MEDQHVANAPQWARWIRAARNQRRISQRELAEISGVERTTIDRIEAGRTTPRVDTFARLLTATGFVLVIQDRQQRELMINEERELLIDRGGRRFPAHLENKRVADYFSLPGPGESWWWGWNRIAWPFNDDWVPEHTFWRRDPPPAEMSPEMSSREMGRVWDDAT